MDGTVELRPRPFMRWASVPGALFFGVGAVFVALGHSSGEIPAGFVWTMGPACVVVTLVMLVSAWRVPRIRWLVTDDGVRLMHGGQLSAELTWADLTEVRPYVAGIRRAFFPHNWTHGVNLMGTDPEGRERHLRAVSNVLPTIGPLLSSLEPVVAQRPELMPGEREQRLFADYLSAARGRA